MSELMFHIFILKLSIISLLRFMIGYTCQVAFTTLTRVKTKTESDLTVNATDMHVTL